MTGLMRCLLESPRIWISLSGTSGYVRSVSLFVSIELSAGGPHIGFGQGRNDRVSFLCLLLFDIESYVALFSATTTFPDATSSDPSRTLSGRPSRSSSTRRSRSLASRTRTSPCLCPTRDWRRRRTTLKVSLLRLLGSPRRSFLSLLLNL